MNFLEVPLSDMCNRSFRDSRERILMKNIAYAGALVAILDVDMQIVEELLKRLSGKKALSNQSSRTEAWL